MPHYFGKKKLLPKKRELSELDTNFSFDEDMFDEDFWLSAEPKRVRMNTLEREGICFKSIWDINVMVNEDSTPPSEAQVIAEHNNKEDTFLFPKEASEDIDESWGYDSYHAPAALVEGRHDGVDLDQAVASNTDILKDAMGQCEIVSFHHEKEPGMITLEVDSSDAAAMLGPTSSTASFIHHPYTPASHLHPSQMYSPTLDEMHPSFPSSPAYTQMHQPLPVSNEMHQPSPVTNEMHQPLYDASRVWQPYAVVAKKSKPPVQKRVGRPERLTPLRITEVPMKGSALLSPPELRKLKYRRMRDLNNEASKKCRQKRKEKQSVVEVECQREEEKNTALMQKLEEMESEVANWRWKCKDIRHGI